jgi:glycosyltransferase involved in cell wall biosynthesis
MYDISIIIPIYNVEKYLYRCLNSVLSQTFINYECILIDDGSTDLSSAICDEYVKKDNRFRVIHQKNMGQAKVRFEGLRQTSGSFIFFIDSDDWIEPDALELLYKKQRETDADIIVGGFRSIYFSQMESHIYPSKDDNESYITYFLLNRCNSLWGKLYKKSLFYSYIEPQQNIGEDAIVNIQIFSQLSQNKLNSVSKIIYNYDRRTTSSILSSMAKRSYISFIDYPHIQYCIWINTFLHEKNVTDEEKVAFSYYIIKQAIIPYLMSLKNQVSREDCSLAYLYYKNCNCSYRKMLPLKKSIIIPLFHVSIFLGRTYIFWGKVITNLFNVIRDRV